MKPKIHPRYQKVVFHDNATGKEWISRSTMGAKQSKEVNGEKLPVIHLEISSESHPFWTGQQRNIDTEGRVDRFRKRYGNATATVKTRVRKRVRKRVKLVGAAKAAAEKKAAQKAAAAEAPAPAAPAATEDN